MKREFKLDFSGMLGIFVAGVVIGILGTILFLSVKDAPTSNPHSIFRDFYLLMARTSYLVDVKEFAEAYAETSWQQTRNTRGKQFISQVMLKNLRTRTKFLSSI